MPSSPGSDNPFWGIDNVAVERASRALYQARRQPLEPDWDDAESATKVRVTRDVILVAVQLWAVRPPPHTDDRDSSMDT